MNKLGLTSKQSWALFLSTGVDCRTCNLSRDEASSFIMLSNKDPESVQKSLIEKGGQLKNPENLKRSLKRLESSGVVFSLKENSVSNDPKVIQNSKTDKKIRSLIFKRVEELAKILIAKHGTEYKAFDELAKILNKEGFRCCNGSKWSFRSVYDFYRRGINKKSLKTSTKSPVIEKAQISIEEIESDYKIDKNVVLKALFACNMEDAIKIEIIKKLYS